MNFKNLVCVLLCFCPLQAVGECLELQGSLIPGGLVTGKVASGDRVILGGQELDLLPDGTFIAGFGRDASGEILLEVGFSCRQIISLANREYRIQRVEVFRGKR